MTKVKFTGPEKRAYLRVPVRCDIKYIKLSKNLRPFVNMIRKSHVRDVAAGGIKFVVRRKMAIGTMLDFQFKMPGSERRVAGLGEVVRITARPGKRSYHVGVRFLWVPRRMVELIDSYVRRKRIEKVLKKVYGN